MIYIEKEILEKLSIADAERLGIPKRHIRPLVTFLDGQVSGGWPVHTCNDTLYSYDTPIAHIEDDGTVSVDAGSRKVSGTTSSHIDEIISLASFMGHHVTEVDSSCSDVQWVHDGMVTEGRWQDGD